MVNILAARDRWLQGVDIATRPFRLQEAEKSRDRAEAASNQGDESGYRWHMGRAHGQEERFERIRDCGKVLMPCQCRACGEESHTVPQRCACHRACLPCRQQRAARDRARFEAGRQAALERLRPLMTRGVGGNQFREVMLTLTVPHGASVSADIVALYGAWDRFRARMRYYLRARLRLPRRTMRSLAFVRVTEVGTQNEGGHVHFHVWSILPFLPHEMLRRWWGEALRDVPWVPVRYVDQLLVDADTPRARRNIMRAAAPRHDARRCRGVIPWPVVDVRQAHDVAGELVKYLVKDLVDGGELVDPVEFGAWYCALEGRRLITASTRFWREVEAACQRCGTVGELRVEVPARVFSGGEVQARGPPEGAGVPPEGRVLRSS